ncbi:hypothetical protein BC938DRAFT_475133 [Jimgerdemannia flammicorona]|uniref:Zn(2)-C6 fungal-type domain-containing protein n=1 Tax=Jimgerdemannia flammicorona TaxID=994334 RepID=A0A433PZW5_9FUNG|nr:hypothetical protein BC938DRAFT_475133 [Jimgerdemannia flammicorona]
MDTYAATTTIVHHWSAAPEPVYRPSKRAKATIACLNCRVKKIRCDAEDKEGACSTCVAKGQACCLPGQNQIRVLSDNFQSTLQNSSPWSFSSRGQPGLNNYTPPEIAKLESDIQAMLVRLGAIAYYLSQDYHGGHFAQFKKFNVTPETLKSEAAKLEKRFNETWRRYHRASTPESKVAGGLGSEGLVTPPTSSDEWEASSYDEDPAVAHFIKESGFDMFDDDIWMNPDEPLIFGGELAAVVDEVENGKLFLMGQEENSRISLRSPPASSFNTQYPPSTSTATVSAYPRPSSSSPNAQYLPSAPAIVPSQPESSVAHLYQRTQQPQIMEVYIDRPIEWSRINLAPGRVVISIANLQEVKDLYGYLVTNGFYADQGRAVPDPPSRQQNALVVQLPRNNNLSYEFGRENRIPIQRVIEPFKNLHFHRSRPRTNTGYNPAKMAPSDAAVLMDLIDHCINVYFSCKNRHAPILYRPTFNKYFRSLGPRVTESPLVMSICAFMTNHALLLHPQGPASIAPLRSKAEHLTNYFFHYATVLINEDILEESSMNMNTIHALSFLAEQCMIFRNKDLGFTYHAMAVRMAQALRIYDYAAPLRNNGNASEHHRRSRGEPLREKQNESELRKRLWWYLYLQDFNYAESGASPLLVFNDEDNEPARPARGAGAGNAHLSGSNSGMTASRPSSSETSFTRTGQIPHTRNAEIQPKVLEGEDEDMRRSIEFWKVSIWLTDVAKDIMNQLYSTKVESESSEKILELQRSLMGWHKKIPESLLESTLSRCKDPKAMYWHHQLEIDLSMQWIEMHRPFFLNGWTNLSDPVSPVPSDARATAQHLELIRAKIDESFQMATSAMANVLKHCARINQNAGAERGLGNQLYCHFPLYELSQVCELYIAILDVPTPTPGSIAGKARAFDAHAYLHGYSESAEEDPVTAVTRMKRDAIERIKDAIRYIKMSVHYQAGTQNHRMYVKRLTAVLEKKGAGIGFVRGAKGMPMDMGVGNNAGQVRNDGGYSFRPHNSGDTTEEEEL